MAIKLTQTENDQLDAFLGELLDSYESGEFTKDEVVSAIAHVFAAAAIDNAAEIRIWLEKPATREGWKTLIKQTR